MDKARGFSELVELFKALDKEQPENTYCLLAPDHVLDSESLCRMLIIWPKIHIKIRPLTGFDKAPRAEPSLELWDWLWGRVSYSIKEWRTAAGVGRNAPALAAILRNNRLVYPDGDVSKSARGVVQGILRGRLQGLGASLGGGDRK